MVMDVMEKQALKENRLHGSHQFPLAAYMMGPIGPGAPVLDCHWHSEAELFYVTEGGVLMQIGGEYFPLRAGEAVFIDGGEIHAGYALEDLSCSYCAVVFDLDFLSSASFDAVQEKYISPLQERSRTLPRPITRDQAWGRSLLALIERFMEVCCGEKPGYEIAAKGLLYLMLHDLTATDQLCNRSEREETSQMQFKLDRLKSVIGHMQLNYQRPIRISELAEQIPMSEGQFCRFFKAMTRQTPIEYLNAYRIRKAAELLEKPHAKIANVAMDVGFDHISYFVKVFRARMKCTPSEYRKRVQAGE